MSTKLPINLTDLLRQRTESFHTAGQNGCAASCTCEILDRDAGGLVDFAQGVGGLVERGRGAAGGLVQGVERLGCLLRAFAFEGGTDLDQDIVEGHGYFSRPRMTARR